MVCAISCTRRPSRINIDPRIPTTAGGMDEARHLGFRRLLAGKWGVFSIRAEPHLYGMGKT